MKLFEYFDINKHLINPESDKQLYYILMYSLGLVKFKSYKTYIKTNLANSFIRSSKFLAIAPILFVQKSNNNLCLYINYLSQNNSVIKNWYL